LSLDTGCWKRAGANRKNIHNRAFQPGLGIFIGLLKMHSIEVVVDVRSSPYSKYTSQFNKKDMQKDIRGNNNNQHIPNNPQL
jgi:hypothetical protein